MDTSLRLQLELNVDEEFVKLNTQRQVCLPDRVTDCPVGAAVVSELQEIKDTK